MRPEVEAIKLIISRFQSRANSEAKDIQNSILTAFDKETCNKTAQQIKSNAEKNIGVAQERSTRTLSSYSMSPTIDPTGRSL